MMRRTWHERLSHSSVTSASTSSSPVISSVMPSSTELCVQGTSCIRARRTWTDPNAVQVDAVHVNVNQERHVFGSGSRSGKGKSSECGKGKSKKGGKGKERGEKAATKFDGECRYCLQRGHEASDCRKMKSDIAAAKCDQSGKPIWVNALSAAGTTQPSPQASFAPSMASTIQLQQMVPVYFLVPTAVRRLNRRRRGSST